MGGTTQLTVNVKRVFCDDSLLQGIAYYSFITTPFGIEMFLASSPEGVLFLGFGELAIDQAKAEFPKLNFVEGNCDYSHLMMRYFRGESVVIDVVIFGSDFKYNVLKTLVDVAPLGDIITYSGLAMSAGCAKAVRAAASAIATNPVSLLIPCHRVVRKSGGIGKYRWGSEVKRAIIENELLLSGKNFKRGM